LALGVWIVKVIATLELGERVYGKFGETDIRVNPDVPIEIELIE